MSRQSMIALGVAALLGLIAVLIANSYLNGTQERARMSGTTKVAVAAVPMAYGTDITPDKIRFVDYPNSSLPPGAFTNAAMLTGKKRVALLPISVNEPILAGKISAEGQGASIAALLPEGMRAASVRINDVSGVAGFVQPNDSVDVLITRQIPGENQRNTQLTDVLIQNVRVIAIDQQARNADGSPKVAKTATLEVNPLDAQKLALAQEVGTLSLVLRKPGEKNNPVVETVAMNDLRYNMYGGARYPAPAVVGGFGMTAVGAGISTALGRAGAAIANSTPSASRATVRRTAAAKKAATAPQPRSVEVYRGTESNEVKVGGNGR
jgi:pilus assembly protein CpaB